MMDLKMRCHIPKSICLFFIALFSSCERSIFVKCPHDYIDVINHSDRSMYVMWGQGGDTSIKASVFGVDPIELGSVTRGGHIEWYCVPPHGSNGSAITKSTGCFSTDYFDKAIPSKRIIVFLFDSSSIYPGKWDSVKQNNIYVRKYILNYDSLELRGWKIVYL